MQYIIYDMKLIELNMQQIAALCKKYKVNKLFAFGSVLTDKFNDKSDIDFLVDFDKDKIKLLDYADNFFGFQFALEKLLNRKVDITEDSAVKNPYFRQELDETKALIYG